MPDQIMSADEDAALLQVLRDARTKGARATLSTQEGVRSDGAVTRFVNLAWETTSENAGIL